MPKAGRAVVRCVTAKSFYDTVLPLGEDYGGPLFWAHYSFLGLNPRGLSDAYADYWEQVCNHTRINYAYCVDNPKGYAGYGADCWGLTASDIPDGYTASSPTNDRGVIAPTAALVVDALHARRVDGRTALLLL